MANAGAARLGDALLERESQLAAFAELLNDVRAGSVGRLVLIGGEAGAGKTAMLERFCRDIAGSGRVMWGACPAADSATARAVARRRGDDRR
jgi:predicted ATP-dependent serine protease